MPCFSPIQGYRSKVPTVNGKFAFTIKAADSNGTKLDIPCGQCIGCRLERSRQWAVRISQEASLYEANCFITLTYSNEKLPLGGSLVVRDFQLFMKKLRFEFSSSRIRFFQCGEYGETTFRPHYHACLLNFDFPDKVYLRSNGRGDRVFTSAILDRLWGNGRTELGSVTFDSAAYVARYITKKITGPEAALHYALSEPILDKSTGEIITHRKPEYTTMSRKPGIGRPFLDKYHKDIFSHDYVVTRNGAKIPPPRYYNNQYEVMNPEHYQTIQSKRDDKRLYTPFAELISKANDNTPERLKVKEIVKLSTINATLKRGL